MDSTQTPRPFNLGYEYATAALHREKRMHHITIAVLVAACIACGGMIALALHMRAENRDLRTRVYGDAMYHRTTAEYQRVTGTYGTMQHSMRFCASLDGDGMVCWEGP